MCSMQYIKLPFTPEEITRANMVVCRAEYNLMSEDVYRQYRALKNKAKASFHAAKSCGDQEELNRAFATYDEALDVLSLVLNEMERYIEAFEAVASGERA